MELRVEVRAGVSARTRRFEPDAAGARAALRSLDGAHISQLGADTGDGRVMLIGGGNEDRFVVNVLIDGDAESHLLADPVGTSEEVELVTGGQRGLFPGAFVVSEALAARALVHFVETGRRDEALVWHRAF